MKKKNKITLVSDYILIVPEVPKAGTFNIGGAIINEIAIIEAVGELCSDYTKSLVDKRVMFFSWKCEEKVFEGQRYYLVPESGNAICAII
jgi:hypothetical protein